MFVSQADAAMECLLNSESVFQGGFFFSLNQVNELHLGVVKSFDPLQISVHKNSFPSDTYIFLFVICAPFVSFYIRFYLISSD